MSSDKKAGIVFSGGAIVGGHQVGVPSGSIPGPFQQPITFDVDEFTALLTQHGHDVLWEKSSYCPNRHGPNPQGDHDISCNICNSSGFIFFDCQQTRMLIQSASLEDMYRQYGRWDNGQVMVTSLPGARLHYWDRITLLNVVGRFSEILRRQPDTDYDSPKYTPLSVLYLAYVDRNGDLVELDPADDIELQTNGQVRWMRDFPNRPDGEQMYTIVYTYNPVYVIDNLIHAHRTDRTVGDVETEFPTQATAKLDFIIRKESEDNPEVIDQSPFPNRDKVR